ncbi:MAG TPA: SgcJ/EcaC family oxidoreductase, partial [Gemmataceae bacterium]|nr:SgcJ/EcaC family oxidoreductase [Gemmataceae bacterium]
MRLRYLWILMLPALGVALVVLPGQGGEPKGNAKDKEAIAKCAEAFLDAFHKGDAKALAAFWTPNGEFIDQTGKHTRGRKALEKIFTALFAEQKDLKARIDSHSLNFVTPNVAIEEGTTEVFAPDGKPPTKVNYTMVHVKKEGEWLIARLRNSPFVPPSNYQH